MSVLQCSVLHNSCVETLTFPENSKISLSQNNWKDGQAELGEKFELFSKIFSLFLSRPCSKLEQITTKWGQIEVSLNLLEGTNRNHFQMVHEQLANK